MPCTRMTVQVQTPQAQASPSVTSSNMASCGGRQEEEEEEKEEEEEEVFVDRGDEAEVWVVLLGEAKEGGREGGREGGQGEIKLFMCAI